MDPLVPLLLLTALAVYLLTLFTGKAPLGWVSLVMSGVGLFAVLIDMDAIGPMLLPLLIPAAMLVMLSCVTIIGGRGQ